MTGDVQIDTIGTVPYAIQVAVDRLAETLEPYAGWAIRLDIDPGIVLVATPARDTDPAETPSEAPLAAGQAQNTPAQAQDAPSASHGGNDA